MVALQTVAARWSRIATDRAEFVEDKDDMVLTSSNIHLMEEVLAIVHRCLSWWNKINKILLIYFRGQICYNRISSDKCSKVIALNLSPYYNYLGDFNVRVWMNPVIFLSLILILYTFRSQNYWTLNILNNINTFHIKSNWGILNEVVQ